MENLKSLLMNRIDLFQKLSNTDEILLQIHLVGHLLKCTVRGGSMVLICGNGGSASQAQHMAGELVSKFMIERRGLPAIALTTNTSILTAVGNDYGYDKVFSKQVEALASPGDIVIGISTSGSSPNVLEGIRAARGKGAVTIALTVEDAELAKLADLCLCMPASSTPRIQEAHITIGHIICELVEEALCV